MTNIGTANMVDRLRARFDSRIEKGPIRGALHLQLGLIQRAALAAPSNCLIAGCKNPPIESHVIPDSFLRRMNDDKSWPFTPQILKDGEVTVAKLRKGTHPKFSGYCHPHDVCIFAWEASTSFSGPNADETQLMRVSDAMWHEYTARAAALGAGSALARPGGNTLATLAPHLGKETMVQLQEFSSSLADSAAETTLLVAGLDELRQALRRSAGLVQNGHHAVVHRISLPPSVGDAPQLADAAWIPIEPQGIGLRQADRVPFAISVLTDTNGTHLAFASVERGRSIVDYLASTLSGSTDLTVTFILHWVRHGCFYWFMGDKLWNGLSAAEQSEWKKDLEVGPSTIAAVYSGAGPERLLIVRSGNGWS